MTRPSRRFWLINLALLLLYGWTLTEETNFSIQVTAGYCTAVVPGRSSSIPCPGLEGGMVGLHLSRDPDTPPFDSSPLERLAPRSARHTVQLKPSSGGRRFRLQMPDELWARPLVARSEASASESVVAEWDLPLSGDFILEAEFPKSDEQAGILLLEPDGRRGWAFIASPQDRRGVWWRWRDGNLSSPIVGIPLQKSFLAQGQSLLRRLLHAHHGALGLLLSGWLLSAAIGRIRKAANRQLPVVHARLQAGVQLLSRAATGRYAPALLTILALLVTFTIASDILERIPHVQDSITYLFQAQTLADGHLWVPAPELPEFFEQEFLLVQDGRWFGKYPPGFPLILALGVLIKQPWLINPILAALTVPLLYQLGKLMYGRSVGITAALLMVASPFFLFMSSSMMAHTAELFWMTLFMLSWMASFRQTGKSRWTFVAGVALGMAFLTRAYTAVAVSVPFVVLTALVRLRASGWANLRPLLKQASLLLLGFVPFLMLLLAYQWAVTGDPLQDPRLLYWDYDHPGFGQDIGMGLNAFTLTEDEEGMTISWFHDPSQPPRGHTPARGLYNTERNLETLEIRLFGWPALLTLAFCWLAFLTHPVNWRDWALLAAGGGLIGAYVFFWASGIMYGPRYWYAALPTFLLLTARGIQGAGEWLGEPAGKRVMAMIASALIIGNLLFFLPNALDAHRDYNFVSGQQLATVTDEIQGKALVFVKAQGTEWWEYGSFFSGNTPELDSRVIYARDLGNDRNGRLMAMYPQRAAYRWGQESGLVAYSVAP